MRMSDAPSLDVALRITKAPEGARERPRPDPRGPGHPLPHPQRVRAARARPGGAGQRRVRGRADARRRGSRTSRCSRSRARIRTWWGSGSSIPRCPPLLLYAHHDVQPEGDRARWTSPPFEPARRDGRLYGRGVVDDKAGVMVHLAAIARVAARRRRLAAQREVRRRGRGGDRLASTWSEFLRAPTARASHADVIVLTDTAQPRGRPPVAHDAPARARRRCDVEVKGYDHALHCGMLGRARARPGDGRSAGCSRRLVTSATARIAVKGSPPARRRPRRRSATALAALPFDASRVPARRGRGEGRSSSTRRPARPPTRAQWFTPQLAITALEAVAGRGLEQPDRRLGARRVGVRIVGGQDPAKVAEAPLIAHLKARRPLGARAHGPPDDRRARVVHRDRRAPRSTPRAARSRAGYGREPVEIGAGGSIPFVGPFARRSAASPRC